MSASPASKLLSDIDSLIRIFERKFITYSVGDVIKVSTHKSTKQTAFAYIRAMNLKHPLLAADGNAIFYGIEFLNYKAQSTAILPIGNGYIGDTKAFHVKNEGYGALIDTNEIVGASVWNQRKSKKAVQSNTRYNHPLFVKAAKYGDIALIKHLMKMKDYPQNPTIFYYAHQKQKIKTSMSAFYAAVFYNHRDIVHLFVTQNRSHDINTGHTIAYETDPCPKLPTFRRVPRCDVLQCDEQNYKNTKFYHHDLFLKLCKDSNIQMLQLLLEHDAWPIYVDHSYALYNVCASGNLTLLKLLLSYIRNPHFINIALPFHKDNRLLIPQTNLSLLNCAVAHKRLDILKYLLSQWKYKEFVIKNRAIYHVDKPHVLPLLLYVIMDTNLHDLDTFTLECLRFLLSTFDADELGLNWVATMKLNEQRHFVHGPVAGDKCFLFAILETLSPQMYNEYLLWLNRGMIIGSLFAALMYKTEILWRTQKDNDNNAKQNIKDFICVFVENGMDWRVSKRDERVKHWLLLWTYHNNIMWNKLDLDRDVCSNTEYKMFIRETVGECITQYRRAWLDAFVLFYNESCDGDMDEKIVNIFEATVLDFVVMQESVLNDIKYLDPNYDANNTDQKFSLFMRLEENRNYLTRFDDQISDEYRRLGERLNL